MYPQWAKIAWAKRFLYPGIRRLTRCGFTSKEWVKFFDWAQKDKYDLITKYIRSK